MKISVITNTIRPEGVALVEKALKRQTFRDFEHIIQGREKPLESWMVWSFNRDMNEAICKSTGDLIVSWQDYTFADPDALEKFWQHYEDDHKTIVSAVGNKYSDDRFLIETWRDPRMRSDQGTYYEVTYPDVEWNLCSVPREVLYKIGGFEEKMDAKFGMDGYSVNERIENIGGYKFMLDQTIKSYSLEHGRSEKWEQNNWIHDYEEIKRANLENPLRNYLK